MSFAPYPKYKDSGVEWLREIPEHWDVCALKRIVSMRSGESITAEQIEEAGQYPVLGGNGLRGFTSAFTHEGNFVIIGRQGALCGNINYASGRFWASEHAIVASPVPPLDSVWLGELLRTMNLNQYSVSAAQPGLSVEMLGNLDIAVPSLIEQRGIGQFLEWETAKIDALIAEERRLINLLNEKRQALISQAVTKGLNLDAPMKPSGVEWLGDVPKHWQIVPLKYLVSLSSGGTPDKSRLEYWDGTIPWASAKDLKSERLSDTEDHITTMAVDHGAVLMAPGSVLVVVRGMILARTFPVVTTDVAVAINQDLKAVLPGRAVHAEFLPWLLRSSSAETLRRLDEAGHGTKALRMEAWTSMELPVPPLAEQRDIARHIDHEMECIHALSVECERGIGLLQERRAALISAAVTGKIDVRNYASSEAA